MVSQDNRDSIKTFRRAVARFSIGELSIGITGHRRWILNLPGTFKFPPNSSAPLLHRPRAHRLATSPDHPTPSRYEKRSADIAELKRNFVARQRDRSSGPSERLEPGQKFFSHSVA